MTVKEGHFERENRTEKQKGEKEEENSKDRSQTAVKTNFSKGFCAGCA